MKALAIGIALVVGTSGAQQKIEDMPPVITVQITSQEMVSVDAADKKVREAEAVLEAAKRDQSQVESEILANHRSQMNIPWADCEFMSLSQFVFSGSTSSIVGEQPEPKGYIAARQGKWIIFTRGFTKCNGV